MFNRSVRPQYRAGEAGGVIFGFEGNFFADISVNWANGEHQESRRRFEPTFTPQRELLIVKRPIVRSAKQPTIRCKECRAKHRRAPSNATMLDRADGKHLAK
jgi:hypothetical protein